MTRIGESKGIVSPWFEKGGRGEKEASPEMEFDYIFTFVRAVKDHFDLKNLSEIKAFLSYAADMLGMLSNRVPSPFVDSLKSAISLLNTASEQFVKEKEKALVAVKEALTTLEGIAEKWYLPTLAPNQLDFLLFFRGFEEIFYFFQDETREHNQHYLSRALQDLEILKEQMPAKFQESLTQANELLKKAKGALENEEKAKAEELIAKAGILFIQIRNAFM